MQHFSGKDFSILLGNIFDHFNSSIYSFIAPSIAPFFFANNDPVVGLILCYSILSTSVISRPLGSYLFGMLAHRIGPSYSLSYSLIGAAIISICISLLPSYSAIGALAPLGLLIFNLLSGIFTAGENAVARIYILEDKQYIDAYKASYIYQASSIFGIILASLAAMIALSYGGESWRLCYIIGGITGFIGYYLRFSNAKSNEKLNKYTSYNKLEFKNLWFKKIILLRIALVAGLSHITYTLPFVIMNNYVPLVTDICLIEMMQYNTIFLIVDLLLIFIIGNLTRNYYPENIMLFSSLTLAITIIPLWQNLAGSSLFYVTFVRFVIVMCGIAFMCPMNLWFKKLVNSSSDQYLIISAAEALGAATIGKLSPSICLLLWHYTQSSLSIAIYALSIALCAAWAIVFCRTSDKF